jgi:3-hydroxyacyl-[acyl-carrier-protein] dehydratase
MAWELDIREILEILPHRHPFLLVDRILDLDLENKTVTGIKNVTYDEPYFKGHFPDDPIMPGVLIIEAMAQTAGILACLVLQGPKRPVALYFMSLDKVRFRRLVRPGDTLTMKIETLRSGSRVWKLKGQAFVGDELACEAELMASFATNSEED